MKKIFSVLMLAGLCCFGLCACGSGGGGSDGGGSADSGKGYTCNSIRSNYQSAVRMGQTVQANSILRQAATVGCDTTGW